MSRFPSRRLLCLMVAGLCVWACSPSYRSDQIVSSIQQISADEYHYDVTARLVGQTLAIHLHHEGLLQSETGRVELSESANEILGNMIEVTHRVLLSSDAPMKFYLLLATDPKVPGVAFTLVRYLDDVRRANANMLTPTEFYSRTIFDLHYVGTQGLNLEQMVPGDISLEQFLSRQLAKRIQARLAETLPQKGLALSDMVKCAGEFEQGEFAFTLSLEPKELEPAKEGEPPQSDELIQQVFKDAAVVIAQVLSDYDFKNFDGIRLIHPPTGRSLLLPKTRLELLK